MSSLSPSPEAAEGTPAPIGRTAVHSVAWQGLAFGLSRAALFATTLMLARLLTPADFGVVAAALTVISYLEIVLDLGMGAALVYEQERGTTRRVHVAFTINIALCVTLTAIGWVLAPQLCEVFGTPGKEWVFRVLLLYIPLRGLNLVQEAVLRRDLRFRRRAVVDVVRAFSRAGISIALAVAGFGVWSIVIGFLASEIFATATLWKLAEFLPRLDFNRAIAGSLMRFGVAAAGLRLVWEVGANVDYLIVGSQLGVRALGYYTLAFRIPETLIGSVYWVFSTVALPVYSRTRATNLGELKDSVLRALRLLALFGFVAGTGLALVARDSIVVALGPRWAPVIVPMTLLSISMAWRSIGYASGDIFPAIGRPGLLLALNIPIVSIIVVWMLLVVDQGIVAIAYVHLVMSIVYSLARLVIGCWVTHTGAFETLDSLRPACAATIGMLILALPVRLALEPGFASLVAVSGCAIVGAVGGLLIAGRSALPELRRVVYHLRH
jgi:PST family polysaccharide transporter